MLRASMRRVSNGYFWLFKVDKLEGVDTGSTRFPGNIVAPCAEFAYKTLGLCWRSAFVMHGQKFTPLPATRSCNGSPIACQGSLDFGVEYIETRRAIRTAT
jgi:hypothetical protein